MGTVTKTLRIDKEFVVIINDYVKLTKDVFGFEISANSVIAGSLVTGFGTYLNTFKMFANFSSTIKPSYAGEKLPTKEQIDQIKLFLVRCEEYLTIAEFGDDVNEVAEAK